MRVAPASGPSVTSDALRPGEATSLGHCLRGYLAADPKHLDSTRSSAVPD